MARCRVKVRYNPGRGRAWVGLKLHCSSSTHGTPTSKGEASPAASFGLDRPATARGLQGGREGRRRQVEAGLGCEAGHVYSVSAALGVNFGFELGLGLGQG